MATSSEPWFHLKARICSAIAALLAVSRGFHGKSSLGHVFVIECPEGTDKGSDGHREDTKFLLEGLRAEGFDADSIFFTDNTADDVLLEVASSSIAFVSRVDPGVYPTCSMGKYFEFLGKLSERGVLAFNHPNDMAAIGSKKSLILLRGLPLSVNDTVVYNSMASLTSSFPRNLERSLQKGGRVLKQNRGSKGEGVWWIRANEEKPVLPIHAGTIIRAVEASNNREVVQTLGQFSRETLAQYFSENNEMVHMEFLPRISEGEIRLVITGRKVIHVVEKRPKAVNGGDGFSANLEAGAQHIWTRPEEWPQVVSPFYSSLDEMLNRMGARTPPALWTADFIRTTSETGSTHFVLSEVNANCVGFKSNPSMGRDLAVWVREEVQRKQNKCVLSM